eukprot:30831-Pelagococcus_subviridis.AAC.4
MRPEPPTVTLRSASAVSRSTPMAFIRAIVGAYGFRRSRMNAAPGASGSSRFHRSRSRYPFPVFKTAYPLPSSFRKPSRHLDLYTHIGSGSGQSYRGVRPRGAGFPFFLSDRRHGLVSFAGSKNRVFSAGRMIRPPVVRGTRTVRRRLHAALRRRPDDDIFQQSAHLVELRLRGVHEQRGHHVAQLVQLRAHAAELGVHRLLILRGLLRRGGRLGRLPGAARAEYHPKFVERQLAVRVRVQGSEERLQRLVPFLRRDVVTRQPHLLRERGVRPQPEDELLDAERAAAVRVEPRENLLHALCGRRRRRRARRGPARAQILHRRLRRRARARDLRRQEPLVARRVVLVRPRRARRRDHHAAVTVRQRNARPRSVHVRAKHRRELLHRELAVAVGVERVEKREQRVSSAVLLPHLPGHEPQRHGEGLVRAQRDDELAHGDDAVAVLIDLVERPRRRGGEKHRRRVRVRGLPGRIVQPASLRARALDDRERGVVRFVNVRAERGGELFERQRVRSRIAQRRVEFF